MLAKGSRPRRAIRAPVSGRAKRSGETAAARGRRGSGRRRSAAPFVRTRSRATSSAGLRLRSTEDWHPSGVIHRPAPIGPERAQCRRCSIPNTLRAARAQHCRSTNDSTWAAVRCFGERRRGARAGCRRRGRGAEPMHDAHKTQSLDRPRPGRVMVTLSQNAGIPSPKRGQRVPARGMTIAVEQTLRPVVRGAAGVRV